MAVTQKDLEKARDDMVKRGVDDNGATDTINAYINDLNARNSGASGTVLQLLGYGGTGASGRAAAEGALLLGAPVIGAGLGHNIGSKISGSKAVARGIEKLPRWVQGAAAKGTRALTPVAEGAGFAGGDIAARGALGMEQNIPQSLAGGAITGTAGAAMRGGMRVGGEKGAGISTLDMEHAGTGLLPAVRRVSRASPHTSGQAKMGFTAEQKLRDRIWVAVEKAKKTTKQRQQKMDFIVGAETNGYRVDARSTIEAIRAEAKSLQGGKSGQGIASGNLDAAKQLEVFADRLEAKAADLGGYMKPTDWDSFVRNDLGKTAYTYAGGETNTHLGKHFRKVKHVAEEEMRRQIIPPKYHKLDKEISAYLEKLDEAETYFGVDAGDGALQAAKQYAMPGMEPRTAALEWLSKNFDRGLSKATMNLRTRRVFGGDIRTISEGETIGKGGTFIRAGVHPIMQATAPFQPWMGAPAGMGALMGMDEAYRTAGGDVSSYLGEEGMRILRAIQGLSGEKAEPGGILRSDVGPESGSIEQNPEYIEARILSALGGRR